MSAEERFGATGSDPVGNIGSATLDLEAMLAGVRRRWKLVLAVFGVCMAAAVVGFRLIPPQYEATVQLLIFDPQWQLAAPSDQRTPLVDFDTVAINTELEVLRSASLALRVARELKLDQYPEFQRRSQFGQLFDTLGLSKLASTKLLEASEGGSAGATSASPSPADRSTAKDNRKIEIAAAILREHLHVDRVPLSYVLLISARSSNPVLAQRVAATVVDDYLADQRETRQNALQEMALWLKARLTELKARVLDTETAIDKLKAKSGLSETGKGNIFEQQIADLNAQLMVARADLADKRAKLEQAQELLESNHGSGLNVPGAATSPLMGQLLLQQSELTRREAELRAKLGGRHAEVWALDVQLAEINKAIFDESARSVAQLQNELDVAVRREHSLEGNLQQLTAKLSDTGDEVKLQQLQRVADADSKLYETYLSQYSEIGTRVSLQVVGAKIISPGEVPTVPAFPRHQMVIYVGAGLLGLAGGVLLALMLEHLRPMVRTSLQVQQTFGHAVIGALPLMSEAGADHHAPHIALVDAVRKTPLSPVGEAVRTIRVGLRLGDVVSAPMVVLVTSCLPGEGKSAVASLLAASSSIAHQRTVLVDCDLRGRTISRNLGKERPGLSEVLTGNAESAAVIVNDSALGCSVLPAGASEEGPSDLLSSQRMREVIAQLRGDFDYIVLDTPPLLSVIDALALAPLADKILLTIDIGRTRQVSIAQALRLLTSQAERIAGMVLNKIPPNQLPKYRFSGYYPG